MKILFISVMRSFIPLRGPLLSEWVQAGHQVTVCGQKDNPETVQKLREMGAQFIPYFLKQHEMNPVTDLYTLLNLVWIIRKGNPDIVFRSD